MEDYMNSSKTTRILIEGAMMTALATVLSIFKLIDMPYGGSVTIASALPLIIFAYRNGIGWGLLGGLSHAVIQQLLGLNTLSYVTGWQSVLAVILLDYIVAFTLVGLGGIFRKACKTQSGALLLGALLISVLRYVCHVISGATVWAGLSIPDEAALIYSFGYNATYMLPETVISCAAAYYLGGLVDFSKAIPERMAKKESTANRFPAIALSGAAFILGMIVDVWLIAPCLQDKKTGEFIISGLANADWLSVGIVTAASIIIGAFLLIKGRKESNS